MRPRDYVPLVLLAGIAGFFVVQGVRNKRDIPRIHKVSPPAKVGSSTAALAGTGTPARADSASLARVDSAQLLRAPAPERDLAAIQTLIKEGSPGTYLMDMLAEQQDTLSHWPQRRLDAIRVFVDRYPGLPDFQPTYPVVVEHVFDEWHEAGFPLRFDFVTDSNEAEITIHWVSKLPPGEKSRIGVTTKTRDNEGWITRAEVIISTHDRDDGSPLSPSLIAGIARHEVGHALGLGHSTNKGDVMYPESTTPVMSRADRATLHLLYILPPGPVK